MEDLSMVDLVCTEYSLTNVNLKIAVVLVIPRPTSLLTLECGA
jgi:hypothetical protein